MTTLDVVWLWKEIIARKKKETILLEYMYIVKIYLYTPHHKRDRKITHTRKYEFYIYGNDDEVEIQDSDSDMESKTISDNVRN